MNMLGEIKRVTCPHCGHSFIEPTETFILTIFPKPIHCPKCGREIPINGLRGILSRLLNLWKHQSPPYSML